MQSSAAWVWICCSLPDIPADAPAGRHFCCQGASGPRIQDMSCRCQQQMLAWPFVQQQQAIAFSTSHPLYISCLSLSCAGELKLADFGLARIFGSPDRKWTNQVDPAPQSSYACCQHCMRL